MKRLLLIIIIHFSSLTCQPWLVSNCFAQQYGWTDISSNVPGDSLFHNLSDLYFINDNEGWINSNTHNEIYCTIDGGTTFSTQSIASTIDAIHMLDANNGHAAADDGSIYRTTNGGTNWNFLAPTFVNLNDITFPLTGSTATGYACGDNGAIYKVTSLGADVMTSGVVSNLQSITFPTATEGWLCGQSVILHFASGSWHGDQGYPSGTYNAIYFTDNQKGWAIGTKIIHTTDGQNWIEQTNPDTLGKTLVDVFFLNENAGWIIGNQGLILHTNNGGINWTIEGDGLTNTLLTGVQFTSSTNGYVVGNNKTLLKYTQITSIEDETTQPTEFKLEQNYPNPFNPSTTIRYTTPNVTLSGVEGSRVQLKVYDVLGNEIATLVNEEKPAGTYEVKFNPASSIKNPASGIYFYQLKAGDYFETKKMILMK